ncbi:copper chaperone CopZ [Staphylococcus epidermidis]|uniref:copper chaperone CopZ n=1 Tax=Staphylococcus epidermidis TaxID=1282 RepID=UPI001C3DFCDF|nr:copper chaperone CopZ [Staphylococcus epidermidis]MBV5133980.1 copper chaperone CopZ [Staphylococcus epidermidis]
MEKVNLKVTGMSCGHCVNKIETALQKLEGVEKANVNLKKAMAKVKYDDSLQTIDKLTDTVRDVGYEAEPIK